MNQFETDLAKRNLSALVDFGNFINSSLDLNLILNNLLLTCFGKFHITKGTVALFDKNGFLKIAAHKGLKQESINSFPKIKSSQNAEEILNGFISENHLKYIQKIVSSQGNLGYIILGEKLNKTEYSEEDENFIGTIVNIASTAIENTLFFEKLKNANRSLDAKVTMLSSLFELSKEFSGVLEEQRVVKLLIYSVIGQLFVKNYAVILCGKDNTKIAETKFRRELLEVALKSCDVNQISDPIKKAELSENHPELLEIGVEVLIPMQVQGITKGVLLLGKRYNQESYSDIDIEYICSAASLAMISIENAKLFKEAIEKQRMEEDLEIARNIQKNLFPRKIPKFENFEISAANISSKQVGGDYYDIIKLDKNRFLFAIGDVSGKGVPASLLMANLQASLKSICKQNLPLSESTGMINDLISENTMGENFITFFWGIIDTENKKLQYVNAGHNPPYLIRKEKFERLKKGGMILGVLPTITPYLSDEIDFEQGDTLILFTDGVTEAMNKKMEEFTEERFEELILKIHHQNSEKIIEDIKSEIIKFADGANQSDDITLMVIKNK